LIVEKSAAFSRRVGEATVEVSGYFLGRVLGLTQHLKRSASGEAGDAILVFLIPARNPLRIAVEIGGRYLSRVPAFQVDRAVLDEEVLRRAQALGAEVWRSATAGRFVDAWRQSNDGGALDGQNDKYFRRAGWWTRPAWPRSWRARKAGGGQ